MKKNSLIILSLIIVFTMMLVAPTCVQACKTQKYIACFHCGAAGEFMLACNWESTPGGNYATDWVIGQGKVAFAGSGKVDKQLPNEFVPVTWYYRDSGIQGRGSISASWGEQSIQLVLNSKGEAGGIFLDEGTLTDTFIVGSGPGAGLVSYKGTHKDSTGTHKVNGKAIVSAGNAPGSTSIWLISATFYKPDNTPFLWITWSDTDISFFNLHAADHFAHYVKITTSH